MDNKKYPVVSVVMAVYNGENYLHESISSVLNQTFRNFEFIIVNDGSTDNTLEIIKSYIRNDNRIVLIDQDNKGLTHSLVRGCSVSKGEYIARQDADDASDHDRLKQQLRYLKRNNNVGIVGTWYRVIYMSGADFTKKPIGNDTYLRSNLFLKNPLCHSSVMFRRNKYIGVGGYDSKYSTSQDLDLWFRMSRVCELGVVEKVLVKRFVYNDSLSVSKKAYSQIYNALVIRLHNSMMVKDISTHKAVSYALIGALYHLLITVMPKYISEMISANVRKYFSI